jgi:hypothetical protein
MCIITGLVAIGHIVALDNMHLMLSRDREINVSLQCLVSNVLSSEHH